VFCYYCTCTFLCETAKCTLLIYSNVFFFDIEISIVPRDDICTRWWWHDNIYYYITLYYYIIPTHIYIYKCIRLHRYLVIKNWFGTIFYLVRPLKKKKNWSLRPCWHWLKYSTHLRRKTQQIGCAKKYTYDLYVIKFYNVFQIIFFLYYIYVRTCIAARLYDSCTLLYKNIYELCTLYVNKTVYNMKLYIIVIYKIKVFMMFLSKFAATNSKSRSCSRERGGFKKNISSIYLSIAAIKLIYFVYKRLLHYIIFNIFYMWTSIASKHVL